MYMGPFQRAADIILASVKWQNALVCLDDESVYLDTVQEHFDLFEFVLRLLRDAEMNLKLLKCHFFKTSVDYLDYNVTPR